MKLNGEAANIAMENSIVSRKPYINRHRKLNPWRVVKSTFKPAHIIGISEKGMFNACLHIIIDGGHSLLICTFNGNILAIINTASLLK